MKPSGFTLKLADKMMVKVQRIRCLSDIRNSPWNLGLPPPPSLAGQSICNASFCLLVLLYLFSHFLIVFQHSPVFKLFISTNPKSLNRSKSNLVRQSCREEEISIIKKVLIGTSRRLAFHKENNSEHEVTLAISVTGMVFRGGGVIGVTTHDNFKLGEGNSGSEYHTHRIRNKL